MVAYHLYELCSTVRPLLSAPLLSADLYYPRTSIIRASIIRGPLLSAPLLVNNFEVIQKNAIKWILNEEFVSYSNYETYLRKCKNLNILPISKHFELTDLCFFHKVLNGYVSTKLPNYVVKYRGNSRLRNKHLDTDCYVSELEQNSKCKLSIPIFKNFFYRTTFLWNKLPRDIRDISNTISSMYSNHYIKKVLT